ncbi:MAG: hypothetical protein QM658_09160 [Gordonia sp. (in: high G+C Gram-positive bacteria)]
MVDYRKWKFWQLFDAGGELAWVAISRPDAPRRLDRERVWTLLPGQQRFIANWFVAQDHQRPEEERRWLHDSITGWDFIDAAGRVPEPSKDDVERIARPEAVLTFEQIDSVPLSRVLTKKEIQQIVDARCAR